MIRHSIFIWVHTTQPFSPVALQFVVDRKLVQATLVSERSRHQTKETSLAIRQRGQDWAAVPRKDPTLQDILRQRLRAIATERSTSTAGIGRQVRHTGTFAGETTTARQKNKEVAQRAAAEVRRRFLFLRSDHSELMGNLKGICRSSDQRLPNSSIYSCKRVCC